MSCAALYVFVCEKDHFLVYGKGVPLQYILLQEMNFNHPSILRTSGITTPRSNFSVVVASPAQQAGEF